MCVRIRKEIVVHLNNSAEVSEFRFQFEDGGPVFPVNGKVLELVLQEINRYSSTGAAIDALHNNAPKA